MCSDPLDPVRELRGCPVRCILAMSDTSSRAVCLLGIARTTAVVLNKYVPGIYGLFIEERVVPRRDVEVYEQRGYFRISVNLQGFLADAHRFTMKGKRCRDYQTGCVRFHDNLTVVQW